MTVTVESFRQTWPAFKDAGIYSDLAINFYIGAGNSFLGGSSFSGGTRWGDQLDYGVGLFIAHHLALDARDALTAQAGGVPGELKGPSTAKSIDKVSQSYDTRAVTFESEAFWNQTRFGVQLMNLAHMVGAGGVQLGVDCDPGFNPFLNFGLHL